MEAVYARVQTDFINFFFFFGQDIPIVFKFNICVANVSGQDFISPVIDN